MQKPLKIYLGDLTYTTISLATDAFPLNIGYIASYCIKRFGSNVDITLFKYIDELDTAIRESPPDILGLSNYCWSKNVDYEMFKMLKEKNPYSLRIWGGPNFPLDFISQENFLKKYSDVDIYVPVDGEVGFSNIVERAFNAKSKTELRKAVLEKPIDGCVFLGNNGKLQFSIPSLRLKNLDEIPSPYLTGLLDKFFDGKLVPMIQTNRGCPFKCTFCTDGRDEVNQVNSFSLQRVKSELNYIAERTPKNIHSLHISDLNFGMFPRDIEICDYISDIQQKYHYPDFIKCTTGKNQKEKIIKAIKKLSNSLRITMSVQSMDQEVLRNIRRDNISVEHMLDLYPAIKEANLHTTSEVILGLPGESYKKHIQTLRDLVRAKMDEILIHTCILLDGSELNTIKERKKWNLKSKFRVIPKDFTKLSNGKNVVETEEIVVGTDSMTFDQYVELRILAFIIFVTNMAVVYDALFKFLRQQNVDIFDVFYRMLAMKNNASLNVYNIINQYQLATIKELWDSAEEIDKHYQNENEYQKLLNNEEGINVLQYYHAILIGNHMDEWLDYTIHVSHELLKEKHHFNENIEKQFQEIARFCKGVAFNIFGNDRRSTNPIFEFNYDLIKWLENKNELDLEHFKLSTSSKIMFILSDEQFNVVQDNLELYGNNPNGRSQVIKRVPKTMLWRKPIQVSIITQ